MNDYEKFAKAALEKALQADQRAEQYSSTSLVVRRWRTGLFLRVEQLSEAVINQNKEAMVAASVRVNQAHDSLHAAVDLQSAQFSEPRTPRSQLILPYTLPTP